MYDFLVILLLQINGKKIYNFSHFFLENRKSQKIVFFTIDLQLQIN